MDAYLSARAAAGGAGGNREGVGSEESAALRRLRERGAAADGSVPHSAHSAAHSAHSAHSAPPSRDAPAATGARRPAPPVLPRGFGTGAPVHRA